MLGGGALSVSTPRRRPNIVLIMADDMGFSDIGCFGSEIDTPNLDRMAAGGVRFTRMYNTARCCPTRASLLTGLYSHQAGVGWMVQDHQVPAYRGFLNDRCVTIAEALREGGYQTLMTGKWHVGERRPHWPVDRGFERYYGLVSGGSNYFSLDPDRVMALDDKPVQPEGRDFYFTDAFSDYAVRFLDERRRDKPFFLYVAYTAPHWPLHAPGAEIRKYQDRYRGGWDVLRSTRHERMIRAGIVDRRWALTPRDEEAPAWKAAPHKDWEARRMAVYAAQIDRMDQGIGRIMRKIRETGAEDNTLVMFLSDNGGCAEGIAANFRSLQGKVTTAGGKVVQYGNLPTILPGPANTFQSYGRAWANASNTPFRLYKHWVHEGGIATPFIAYWPSATRARGAIVPQVGHVIDLLPTCLDAAGVSYPRTLGGRNITLTQGISLVPAMAGSAVNRPGPLFWEHEGNCAVLDGEWKIVRRYGAGWELYNLARDRTELVNLAAADPERAKAMAGAYAGWAEKCGVLTPDQLRRIHAI